ncbi:unnamed protein product (macronuclear) [Paramecium tetraurelia]|uniref:Transmembrane protein n=1 Tax=Paramecium tetraurelia TaxID=5888 RepID=A0BGK4_PARTE|nr:uncharacterized protein GSPATT00028706001 [Paramecium tetraurelia]CAK57671.1 unnamed protein product [Paramecium tetraurelia]|eukprot:XP_001425069.1 hypothetical protein (macronuclear) [Paramecium tetraurelia strain d4-2]
MSIIQIQVQLQFDTIFQLQLLIIQCNSLRNLNLSCSKQNKISRKIIAIEAIIVTVTLTNLTINQIGIYLVAKLKVDQCQNSCSSLRQIEIKNVDIIYQSRNSFAYVYNAGGILCRVNHGCNTIKIQLNQGVEISHLPYNP